MNKRHLVVISSMVIALTVLLLSLMNLGGWVQVGGAMGFDLESSIFIDSGQALGTDQSSAVALGDLDLDGDIDAFVANVDAPHAVYLNQGGFQGGVLGKFSKAAQNLGEGDGVDVSLGDLDNDGDLDAVVLLNSFGDSNQVWINLGGLQAGVTGTFTTSAQIFGDDLSSAVALGLLDGDAYQDLFVTRSFGRVDKVWTGGGNGLFTDTSQALSTGSGSDLALGDFDGDDDLDAYIAMDANNAVWLNQGGIQAGNKGVFLDSGQVLTSSLSLAVALGDLDNDSDLDAFVANSAADKVWVNQGGIQGGMAGMFYDSGQSLNSGLGQSRDIALGDVDGDGDLDAFLAKSTANEIWLNLGGDQAGSSGSFADSGERLGNNHSEGVALADLDGDGDLDAFVANWDGPNKIWFNQTLAVHNYGQFIDSGQRLGIGWSHFAGLADLDGDGDPDLVMDDGDQVTFWENDGAATFSQHLGIPATGSGNGLAIGDFNGDLALDVVIAGVTNTLINDGSGSFQAAESLPGAEARDVTAGDLDGDGDLDLLVRWPTTFTYEIRSWINMGGLQGGTVGEFEYQGGRLGEASIHTNMALGDLDGDGDLDAILNYTGTDGDPYSARVWLNQGGAQLGTEGDFDFSGHSFDGASSDDTIIGITLGDVDGDGDLDAYLAKGYPDPAADRLWLNSGGLQGGTPGIFIDSGQNFETYRGGKAALADIDGDDDLDLLVIVKIGYDEIIYVWLNEGGLQEGTQGSFVDSGQRLNAPAARGVHMGDLNGDGYPEAVIQSGGRNMVWLNVTEVITPSFAIPYNLIEGDDGYVLPWWPLSNASLPVQVTRDMNTTVQVKVGIRRDALPNYDTLVYPPGMLTQYPTYEADKPGGKAGEIWNPYFGLEELGPSDKYYVSLQNQPGAIDIFGIDTLQLIFYNPDSQLRNCFLDGVNFLRQLAGSLTAAGSDLIKLIRKTAIDLNLYYQVRDDIMAASPQGRYYRGLYYAYSPELLQITSQNVGLLGKINRAIEEWSPAFQALVDGQGGTATITPAMIEQAIELLEAYEAEASPELAAIIREEMDALNLASFAGLTMDEALVKVNERPVGELFLPAITR